MTTDPFAWPEDPRIAALRAASTELATLRTGLADLCDHAEAAHTPTAGLVSARLVRALLGGGL